MSTVAWAEFLCGPLSQSAIALAARIVTELIPFGENQTEVATILFNQSGRRRGSMIDCMIAAAALERGAELATSDLKDFERLETLGLRLVTFP
jgi:predicted nucleic acid-binding protein